MLTLGKKTLSVPILQGGMGVGVSLGGLAGAVAACGGMGCISTADAGYPSKSSHIGCVIPPMANPILIFFSSR